MGDGSPPDDGVGEGVGDADGDGEDGAEGEAVVGLGVGDAVGDGDGSGEGRLAVVACPPPASVTMVRSSRTTSSEIAAGPPRTVSVR